MNTEELVGLIRPLAEVEREHIENAIRLSDGNKAVAARALGVSLTTIYSKLRKYKAEMDLPRVARGWLEGRS